MIKRLLNLFSGFFKEERKMGVSMGIIKPIRGKAARDLLKDMKYSSVDEKVLEQCKKISSLINRGR